MNEYTLKINCFHFQTIQNITTLMENNECIKKSLLYSDKPLRLKFFLQNHFHFDVSLPTKFKMV